MVTPTPPRGWIQGKVLMALDEHEGTSAFDLFFVLPLTHRQIRSALQRLRKAGLASWDWHGGEPVWFRERE